MKEKYIRLKDLMKYMDEYYGVGTSLEKIPTRKPTHGNCCTCQDCGYGHDECICEHNDWVDAVNGFTTIMVDCGKLPLENISNGFKLREDK